MPTTAHIYLIHQVKTDGPSSLPSNDVSPFLTGVQSEVKTGSSSPQIDQDILLARSLQAQFDREVNSPFFFFFFFFFF